MACFTHFYLSLFLFLSYVNTDALTPFHTLTRTHTHVQSLTRSLSLSLFEFLFHLVMSVTFSKPVNDVVQVLPIFLSPFLFLCSLFPFFLSQASFATSQVRSPLMCSFSLSPSMTLVLSQLDLAECKHAQAVASSDLQLSNIRLEQLCLTLKVQIKRLSRWK